MARWRKDISSGKSGKKKLEVWVPPSMFSGRTSNAVTTSSDGSGYAKVGPRVSWSNLFIFYILTVEMTGWVRNDASSEPFSHNWRPYLSSAVETVTESPPLVVAVPIQSWWWADHQGFPKVTVHNRALSSLEQPSSNQGLAFLLFFKGLLLFLSTLWGLEALLEVRLFLELFFLTHSSETSS